MCPLLWTGRPCDPHQRRMCGSHFLADFPWNKTRNQSFSPKKHQKTTKHRTELSELRILACANSSCPFRVHPEAHLGGFCCTSLLASDAHDVQSATWWEFSNEALVIYHCAKRKNTKIWRTSTMNSPFSRAPTVGLPAGIQHPNSFLSPYCWWWNIPPIPSKIKWMGFTIYNGDHAMGVY